MNNHIIDIIRHNPGNDSTVGILLIDGGFHCYTLEDEYRAAKISGETRIPMGDYDLKLRTSPSGMNGRYLQKFGDFHKGMLWLRDVPGFEWIYIHIGNNESNTDGCILVGYDTVTDEHHGGGSVPRSTPAYKKLYEKVYQWLEAGDSVTVAIREGL